MAAHGGLILVVEDDAPVRRWIADGLTTAGFEVQEAASMAEAQRAVETGSVALVVLDLGMPDGSGLDFLKTLTRPAIIVSGHATETDRVVGLELGADDYVAKPFSRRELVARVRCVLRRTTADATHDGAPEFLVFPGLTVDCRSREVTARGRSIDLTRLEFDLLVWLASHPRQVFTKSHLLATVWGCEDDWTNDATVTEHVRRLRKKLEACCDGHPMIVTVWGVGYRFEPPQSSARTGRSAVPV